MRGLPSGGDMGRISFRIDNPMPSVEHAAVRRLDDGELVIVLPLGVRVSAVILERRLGEVVCLLSSPSSPGGCIRRQPL